MEEVFLRFPHLGESIFQNLDNENLSKCLEVGRSWKSFIDFAYLMWIRIKKKYPLQNEAQVQRIYRYEITIKGENYCTTDLHLAALTGQTEIFEFLFEKDFLSEKNSDPFHYIHYDHGMTPFHLAAAKGRLGICRFIVYKIGNPSTKGKYLPYWKSKTMDEDKWNEIWKDVSSIMKSTKILQAQSKEAFDIACKNRHEKVAKLLLENAKILKLNLARCFERSYISDYILTAKFIINNATETVFDFNRALKTVCQGQGDRGIEIAKLLIERIDIEKIDETSCLIPAFYEYGSMKIANLLIGSIGIEKIDAKTIFRAACQKGLWKAEKFLMENSAVMSKIKFNEKDEDGQSAFHVVCRNGRTDFAEFLIKKSKELEIDFNAQDNQGMTGFHLACKIGKTLRKPQNWSFRGKPKKCISILIFQKSF